MNKQQKKIEKQLLKDIKNAKTIGEKNQAVNTYKDFVSACEIRNQ